MTAEMQVTIAALACVLILGQDDFYFDNVATILVYPKGYRARRRQALAGEAVIEGTEELLGEADYAGPIILAWSEVLHAAARAGLWREPRLPRVRPQGGHALRRRRRHAAHAERPARALGRR